MTKETKLGLTLIGGLSTVLAGTIVWRLYHPDGLSAAPAQMTAAATPYSGGAEPRLKEHPTIISPVADSGSAASGEHPPTTVPADVWQQNRAVTTSAPSSSRTALIPSAAAEDVKPV